MSLDDYRGAAYYIRELFRQAARDIEQGGDVKPARVLYPAAKWPTVGVTSWPPPWRFRPVTDPYERE